MEADKLSVFFLGAGKSLLRAVARIVPPVSKASPVDAHEGVRGHCRIAAKRLIAFAAPVGRLGCLLRCATLAIDLPENGRNNLPRVRFLEKRMCTIDLNSIVGIPELRYSRTRWAGRATSRLYRLTFSWKGASSPGDLSILLTSSTCNSSWTIISRAYSSRSTELPSAILSRS